MIRETAQGAAVEGAMTLPNASALLAGGVAALRAEATVFDLAAVTEVDSSGLAVVFAWQRAAARDGRGVRLANPPANLLSLAELYGVSNFLPLA